jgi:hypothetical protein
MMARRSAWPKFMLFEHALKLACSVPQHFHQHLPCFHLVEKGTHLECIVLYQTHAIESSVNRPPSPYFLSLD